MRRDWFTILCGTPEIWYITPAGLVLGYFFKGWMGILGAPMMIAAGKCLLPVLWSGSRNQPFTRKMF